MSKKTELKDAVEKLLFSHDGKIIILNYVCMNKTAVFKCADCGNEWNSIAHPIIIGKRGCPTCANKRKGEYKRLSIDYIRNFIESKNCELLSENYKNNTKKMEIKFPCGHINFLSYAEFRKNFGCDKCRKETFYKNKYPEGIIIELVNNLDFEFLGFINEYENGSSHILYRCSNGHITDREVKNFIKFPTCKQCKIISRGESQRGENAHGWKGGISKVWIAARARLDPWMNNSFKSGSGMCCITGQKDIPIDVHHLRSFNLIVQEALNEFGLDFSRRDCLRDYGENSDKILSRIVELNSYYGLGVCVRKDLHILYHKIYKHGNNTPSQFYEFQQKIASGEITI